MSLDSYSFCRCEAQKGALYYFTNFSGVAESGGCKKKIREVRITPLQPHQLFSFWRGERGGRKDTTKMWFFEKKKKLVVSDAVTEA